MKIQQNPEIVAKYEMATACNGFSKQAKTLNSFDGIFAFCNPMWMSDVFVCGKIDGYDKICFVKLNYDNKIEEIGIDIERRVSSAAVNEKFIEDVTEVRRNIFESIGGEYWWGLINRERFKNEHYQI